MSQLHPPSSSRSVTTATTTASSSTSSVSPNKPRLLWRGSLLLPDGTALPGIAFVCNVQPSFSSLTLPTADKLDSPRLPPLTLAKEQQDELGLSIEMVRHAPINVVEVIQKVDRDDDGTMLKPKRIISSNPKENSDQFRVSYEASGGIRMYVDPAYPSSVAYLERLFCYEEEEQGDEDEEMEAKDGLGITTSSTTKEYRSSNNVIVISLDKSYRYNLDSSSDAGDVFSDQKSTSAWQASSTSGNGAAIEAVLMGIRNQNELGTTLEMHVGQKVICKLAKENDRSMSEVDQKGSLRFGMRPDDPAPRGLSRVLSAKYRSTPPILNRRSSSSSSSSPAFVPPLQPGPRESFSGLKRPDLLKTDPRSSSMPNLKRESSSSDLTASSSSSTTTNTKTDKRPRITATKGQSANNIDEFGDSRKIEERNRSLIKKLVHHQLLGKGLEKNDEEYLACFNPTCNGTVLALKKQVKTEIIEKVVAASIIERHLDMYL